MPRNTSSHLCPGEHYSLLPLILISVCLWLFGIHHYQHCQENLEAFDLISASASGIIIPALTMFPYLFMISTVPLPVADPASSSLRPACPLVQPVNISTYLDNHITNCFPGLYCAAFWSYYNLPCYKHLYWELMVVKYVSFVVADMQNHKNQTRHTVQNKMSSHSKIKI